MNIKRYLAPDMRRAINLVRSEHGPDAVILSSESVDGGVEIIAAVDYDQNLVARAFGRQGNDVRNDARGDNRSAARNDDRSDARNDDRNDDRNDARNDAPEAAPAAAAAAPRARPRKSFWLTAAAAAAEAAEAAAAPSPAEASKQAKEPKSAAALQPAAIAKPAGAPESSRPQPTTAEPANAPAVAAPAATAAADDETTRELRAIHKDLFALKGLVRERFAWSDLRTMSPQRNWLMRRAEAFGLTAELADTVVGEVEHPELDDRAWRELVFGLARRLSVMREDPIDEGGVFALVGPTGVGKTTTIAKLAARHCLRHGRESIALITTDNYRIGAQRQLEAFAAILGVPVRTADSPEKLARLLRELSDRRLVLIDTAGSAPRDVAITGSLASLDIGAKIRRFLVLAANMQATVMSDAVRAFGGRELAGIVLTKLDETNALGAAISVLIGAKLPAVWLSDGQRVPEDLKLARVAHLLKRATAVERNGDELAVPAFAGERPQASDGGRVHAGI